MRERFHHSERNCVHRISFVCNEDFRFSLSTSPLLISHPHHSTDSHLNLLERTLQLDCLILGNFVEWKSLPFLSASHSIMTTNNRTDRAFHSCSLLCLDVLNHERIIVHCLQSSRWREKKLEREKAQKRAEIRRKKRNSLFSSGKIFRRALLRPEQRPSCIVVVCFGLPTTRAAFEQAAEKTQASSCQTQWRTRMMLENVFLSLFFLWKMRNEKCRPSSWWHFFTSQIEMNERIHHCWRAGKLNWDRECAWAYCMQSTSSCENRFQHVWGLSSGRFSKQNLMHIVKCTTCVMQLFITFKLLSTTVRTMIAVFEKFSGRQTSLPTSSWNFTRWLWFYYTIHLAHWDWMKVLENGSSFQEIKKCWKFATSLATSLSKCWAMKASIRTLDWINGQKVKKIPSRNRRKNAVSSAIVFIFLFGHRLLVVDEIWYNGRWRAGTNRSERIQLKSLWATLCDGKDTIQSLKNEKGRKENSN